MKHTIDQIAEVAGYLWQKGWAERNGGNITVNITDQIDERMRQIPPLVPSLAIGKSLPALKGQFFYAKGTGKRMRDLARRPMEAGSIIRITDDCAHYDIIAEHPVMPTSELPSHLEIQNYLLQSGSTCRATLHTHPIELVAMSHSPQWLDGNRLTRLLWSMIPETLAFAPLGIGVVPYALPGSLSLAEQTLAQIRHHDVVLWEKHGVFAVGDDIIEAFDQVDVLNKAAIIYMSARSMGFVPEGMTDDAIAEIQQVFHLPTQR
ncbi:MAG: rhamnulose-1-phosphate aldolase [Bacteroidales bacterium]|nr:rhamnulose-1-phosphate aldolase [Bacteroidales bacterium]